MLCVITYWVPISVGSFSSIVVNVLSSGGSDRDEDAILKRARLSLDYKDSLGANGCCRQMVLS